LEIFFYSGRAGGIAGSTDLWTSTRASVDEPWSTPVDVGAPVDSSVTEIHPYLSADGRSLVFSSTRPGGSGSSDLYVATRTVTYDSLCALTQLEVPDAGIANSLCKKLDAAAASAARGNTNARAGQLGAYRNELGAQAGEALTPAAQSSCSRSPRRSDDRNRTVCAELRPGVDRSSNLDDHPIRRLRKQRSGRCVRAAVFCGPAVSVPLRRGEVGAARGVAVAMQKVVGSSPIIRF
jgi:hypothetical protein